jgi:phosphoribosylglycinamide formyltransferase-1
LVVLVSGTGSILQALLDACADPGFGAEVVAVGADREGTGGVDRAQEAGIPTFVRRLKDSPDRFAWDRELTADCAKFEPDLVIAAGFLKLVGADFLTRFGGRMINTHPALLPAFPGMHSVRDALACGVKVTGCSVILVDAGVDSGPILAQAAVPSTTMMTKSRCTSGSRWWSARSWWAPWAGWSATAGPCRTGK